MSLGGEHSASLIFGLLIYLSIYLFWGEGKWAGGRGYIVTFLRVIIVCIDH